MFVIVQQASRDHMWWVGVTAAMCGLAMPFTFFLALRLPKGIPRLLAVSPFLPPFLVLVRLLPSPMARASLIMTCYCPCKLLLLCFDRYVDHWPTWTLSGLPRFVVAFSFPLRIKGPAVAAFPASSHVLHLIYHALPVICFFLAYPLIPQFLIRPGLCLLSYFAIALGQRIFSLFLHALFQVDLLPVFNKPWLAASLTEFWGERWNLTVSAFLRQAVYNPLLQDLSGLKAVRAVAAPAPAPARGGHAGANENTLILLMMRSEKPVLWIRVAAVCATFLASGLIHELLYFCITEADRPTWEVTAFFLLHGLVTSVEIVVRRTSPHHPIFNLPRDVKVLWTISFLCVTASWLLISPLVTSEFYLQCAMEMGIGLGSY